MTSKTSAEPPMLDDPTAQKWAAQANFVTSLRRWTWAREALPDLMRQLAAAGADTAATPVDMEALACAFWPWAATLDDSRQFEPLEPVDYAHYACGLLLAQLLQHRPLSVPKPAHPGPSSPSDADRHKDVRILTGVALTLLQAWRLALCAGPLDPELGARLQAHWANYLENVAEDCNLAVAFLDLFTGREPVWRYSLMLVERPLFQQALERRRNPMT